MFVFFLSFTDRQSSSLEILAHEVPESAWRANCIARYQGMCVNELCKHIFDFLVIMCSLIKGHLVAGYFEP